MNKSYNAGAAVRNAATTTASTVARGTKGAAGAVRDFWRGLTSKPQQPSNSRSVIVAK